MRHLTFILLALVFTACNQEKFDISDVSTKFYTMGDYTIELVNSSDEILILQIHNTKGDVFSVSETLGNSNLNYLDISSFTERNENRSEKEMYTGISQSQDSIPGNMMNNQILNTKSVNIARGNGFRIFQKNSKHGAIVAVDVTNIDNLFKEGGD